MSDLDLESCLSRARAAPYHHQGEATRSNIRDLAASFSALDSPYDPPELRPPSGWHLSRWRHAGNGKVYVVVSFGWLGDTDEWTVLHVAEDAPHRVCVRTITNFTGLRDNGEPRFVRLA